MDHLEAQIDELADKYFSRLLEIRRHLHMHPELSNQEFKTTNFINQELDKASIKKLPLISQTGTSAEISGSDGPIVALRADIDALPIQEESDLPFRSVVNGISHMCGHDVHTTIALGVGFILQELKHLLPGTVRLIFQPAEESEGGAEAMIAEGLLNDVKAIIGLHNMPDLPVGTIGLKEGFLMASVDDFTVKIKGKGGHAALPEKAIDPIVIGSAVVNLLQTLVSRTISPRESAVITVGSFQAGNTHNVIPEFAVLKGTVRTSSETVRKQIQESFQTLVQNLVHSLGGEVEIDYQVLLPAVFNHSKVTSIVRDAAISTVGIDKVVAAEATMGGEDFSFYQQKVPGCYVWLGSRNKEKDIIYGWHHPKFMVDEDAIKTGVKLMTRSVFKLLTDTTLSI
ncbi:M20 family metallopeptidase [Bacillus sp. AFS041924]|uniref:M20 metallopeptidase family protein n=1 Tax=Bacillus sp. AFS041924 TaxID=2033503 RepID=UPI000BFD4552|nr:amidohydrolase [Bacillus sp. AFS041924]PGS49838.1 hydrolase [Bacillus sp. AFS041924]